MLEIGSGRAKNGVFLNFVRHDTGTKMSSRAQISGKRAAILYNITQFENEPFYARKRYNQCLIFERKMPSEVTLDYFGPAILRFGFVVLTPI